MTKFSNDYQTGCHPDILKKIIETNLEITAGYGLDSYCDQAKKRIKQAIKNDDADIHFLVGGTQTNATVIDSMLRPYQGVIAAHSGHIAVHETGAIEATGHKVLTLPTGDGICYAEQIQNFMENYYIKSTFKEHIVQPAMVYISHPSELGILYSKKELQAISRVCRRYQLFLFIDGARLGYALNREICDIELTDLAELTDVFYIGGTKCGALFGEAVVIVNKALQSNFRAMIKQHGGLLAKGRLLGIQFSTLFENNLYQKICQNAVRYALDIRAAFEQKKIRFFGRSGTNQQFPILTPKHADFFAKHFGFVYWDSLEQLHVMRYCTNWSTKQNEVETLLEAIEML
ncbi:hypothetical protein COMNV_00944 [Commensalibacter sp. Nvir]|uniref:threonine aldolase family protein n=1 Tax=Commensalibacter sp. Nvir TaxID=3069817 RepID=UPI002D3EA485|nr:hypothetical protein COMNV_00944 [Commensalibacter sp. Nvir]